MQVRFGLKVVLEFWVGGIWLKWPFDLIKSNIPVLHNLYKVICTYQLPWCVAGTISVGCRSTGKWTTADAWIIFKVYDCEKRKYWKGKRKHKEERKNRIYVFYKKCGPKLIFFNDLKKYIPIFFDIENWLWKSDFWTFWQLTFNPTLKIQSFPLGMFILRQKYF